MGYIDILPDLVYSYNFSIHRSIKIRPADVTTKKRKENLAYFV